MASQIYQFRTNEIDKRSFNPLFHDVAKWFKDSGGIWNKDFDDIAANSTLCLPFCVGEFAPQIISIGSRSSARVWGDGWANSVHNIGRCPVDKLETLSAIGYKKALTDGLSYDLVDHVGGSDSIVYECVRFKILSPKNGNTIFTGCVSQTLHQA